jgi:hypothetical protein
MLRPRYADRFKPHYPSDSMLNVLAQWEPEPPLHVVLLAQDKDNHRRTKSAGLPLLGLMRHHKPRWDVLRSTWKVMTGTEGHADNENCVTLWYLSYAAQLQLDAMCQQPGSMQSCLAAVCLLTMQLNKANTMC